MNLGIVPEGRYAVTGDIGVIEEAVSVSRAALRINPGNEAALAVLGQAAGEDTAVTSSWQPFVR